jgi:hypothetical protein
LPIRRTAQAHENQKSHNNKLCLHH